MGSDVNGSSGSPKWVAVATGLRSDRSKHNKHNVGCILSQQTAVTDIIPVYWLKHQNYSREADAKWKCRVVSWHDQWQTAPSTLVKIMYQLEPNQQAVSNYSLLHVISCGRASSLYRHRFQTFALFCMLYDFFWVIARPLNFICRLFGTLCLFHLYRQLGVEWLYLKSVGLEGLLSHLTGNSTHHVKNSFQFVQILESLRVQPEGLMVSFDVVSVCQRSDCGFTWTPQSTL